MEQGRKVEAEAKRKRKPPIKHEGERFRIALVKSLPDTSESEWPRLSFSVSPSAIGYTLRARVRDTKGLRMAVEHFSESQYGDSFNAAKRRAIELSESAKAKGWLPSAQRKIEDLF